MAAKRTAIAETEVVAGGQLRAVRTGRQTPPNQDAALPPIVASSPEHKLCHSAADDRFGIKLKAIPARLATLMFHAIGDIS